ncbi:MAG: bifunctional diguanylate cyclase/phosphodiesterase [Rhodoferax sp.]|uniref:putative bifunctional diguanylate cyclase/phosphodiesterase n=1 Tax=Rhodoferax sp. TaxID=50421 RepID=UPI00263854A0|nr:bifunctional diguanylate cyclase/phosphodiesterase [Rhodoferax sp.]MDD5333445.1 bifunctional diguanylate cyclase/phosphodiesterase [Rhodoferax sp.]
MNPGYFSEHPGVGLGLAAACLVLAVCVLWLYWRERRRNLRLSLELKRVSHQMSTQSERDELTGLLTRSGFDAVLDTQVQKVDSAGGAFCVLYVALDNFGLLNDAFGQGVGDRLLKDVAQRLVQCTGPKAEACRIAAGEFALIVNGALAVGRTAASRVINTFAESFKFDLIQTQLSCSIGIASYPEHGSRAKLMGHAATAMRSVKLNGGSAFCQYDVKMGVEVREQAILVNELRNALELGQFELYFQPKIDAVSLQVTAAEVLLRWHHPERGLVSPVLFIPLAERYGLIGAIGNWVIEEACRKAAGWRERGLRMRVAVNISGYQMREDDLVERIEAALHRNGLQPGRFTCEITESVAMEDTKVTQLTFDKMRKAGFHVSIDDFGTGYSSLAALRRLPAAELKIDRAFVCDLEESEEARSIVKSIVSVAAALHLRVVAEGVETVGQCDLLVSLGCDELQGYLFSMPVPAEELERLALDEHRLKNVEFRPSLFSSTLAAELNPGLRPDPLP